LRGFIAGRGLRTAQAAEQRPAKSRAVSPAPVEATRNGNAVSRAASTAALLPPAKMRPKLKSLHKSAQAIVWIKALAARRLLKKTCLKSLLRLFL
jgi:hypothetical protein